MATKIFFCFVDSMVRYNHATDHKPNVKQKIMKLPVIKQLTQFIEENDQDYIIETIEVLEAMTEIPSLKDEELDVIGELISNMYGALEVHKMVVQGTDKKEALNAFMKRVLGSIDK